jgi:hypothetical protein
MTDNITKGLRILLLIGVYCVGLTACAAPNMDNLFFKRLAIPTGNYLDITYLGSTPANVHSDFSLYAKNTTKDCIVFPHDYGTQIFVYLDKDWKNISDLGEYPNPNDIKLDPAGSLSSDAVIYITPDFSSIPSSAYPIKMRIVVVGRLCQNGLPTENKTADYIELSVNKP